MNATNGKICAKYSIFFTNNKQLKLINNLICYLTDQINIQKFVWQVEKVTIFFEQRNEQFMDHWAGGVPHQVDTKCEKPYEPSPLCFQLHKQHSEVSGLWGTITGWRFTVLPLTWDDVKLPLWSVFSTAQPLSAALCKQHLTEKRKREKKKVLHSCCKASNGQRSSNIYEASYLNIYLFILPRLNPS